MAKITNAWIDDAHRIMVMTMPPPEWTMDELLDAMKEANDMTTAIDHWYVSMIDTRQSKGFVPRDILGRLPEVFRASNRGGHSAGIVVIAARSLSEAVSNIFSKVYMKLTIVNTMEKALEFAHASLRRVDTTYLPPVRGSTSSATL
jgi:hypothetical protein